MIGKQLKTSKTKDISEFLDLFKKIYSNGKFVLECFEFDGSRTNVEDDLEQLAQKIPELRGILHDQIKTIAGADIRQASSFLVDKITRGGESQRLVDKDSAYEITAAFVESISSGFITRQPSYFVSAAAWSKWFTGTLCVSVLVYNYDAKKIYLFCATDNS